MEKSDAELAQQLSAALMGQVAEELTTNGQSLTAPTLTRVPPFSSFGQAWARFNQALREEPFATFAKAHHIDLSDFSWNPQQGTMTCMINGSPTSFTEFTPGWSQASTAVAAAARELGAPSTTWFRYTGENTPPGYLVGDFYAIARTELTRNPRAVIAALQQADTFPSLVIPNGPLPLDISQQTLRARQAQRSAKETITQATFERSGTLADSSRTPTPAERVEAADREVARDCARILARIGYQRRIDDQSPTFLPSLNVPDDSTYARAREAFGKCFSNPAFLAFAKEHNLEVSSLFIHLPTGQLEGYVRNPDGSRKSIVLRKSTSPQWAALEPDISSAARKYGRSGSVYEGPVNTQQALDLSMMLDFYGVTRETGSEQKWLEQVAGLIRDGFPSLKKNNPSADTSRGIRELQQAALQTLAGITTPPTPTVVQAPAPVTTAKPPVASPVSDIAHRLFNAEPGLQSVVSGLLKDAIDASLNLDVEQLAFAVPDPDNPGEHIETPLMEMIISHVAGGAAPVFDSAGKFVDTREDVLARTGKPAGTALPIDRSALQKAMSELPGKLNETLRAAKITYWNESPFNEPAPGLSADTALSVTPIYAGSRRSMLGQLLHSNLRLASLKSPGLNDIQRETLDTVARFPHGHLNPTDNSKTTIHFMVRTDPANPDSPNVQTPNLFIERKAGDRTLAVLMCEPSGKVTPYASLDAAQQAWEQQNPEAQPPTRTDKPSLKAFDADAFYLQANVMINNGDVNAATDPALIVAQQSQASRLNLPEWTKSTTDANRFIYHDLLLDMAGFAQRNKGRSYGSDIPDIHSYINRELHTPPRPPFPFDVKDVEVTFHASSGIRDDLLYTTTPTTMPLVEAMVKNVANLPHGVRVEVRHKTTGIPIPRLQEDGALFKLIEDVNVGKNYPDLIKQKLLDDPAQRIERQSLFAQQVPIELKMRALALTAKGELGFDNNMGWRYINALLNPMPGAKIVNGNEITIRPLAFAIRAGAEPDVVDNAFLIGPKDSTIGPHILYRPSMGEHALRMFPSHQALMEAIQKPGRLQNEIVAWLPNERARNIYDKGGFLKPHLPSAYLAESPLGTPQPPTLALEGDAASDLEAKLQAGQLMNHLYETNARAMTALAQSQTVSNSEARWASLFSVKDALVGAAMAFFPPEALLVGMTMQAHSLLNDIKTVGRDGKEGKEEAAADLFINLAMLLLHIASPSSSKPTATRPALENKVGMFSSNDVAPRPITNSVVELGGRVENVNAIDGGIQFFEDIYNGQKRINIVGHGYPPEKGRGTRIMGDNGKSLSAGDIYNELLMRGVDIRKYKEGRILTCYSANGDENSLAAQLHTVTGIPFKGFRDEVFSGFRDEEHPRNIFKAKVDFYKEHFPDLSMTDIQLLVGVDMQNNYMKKYISATAAKPHGKSFKVNLGTADEPVYTTIDVNYQPSRFGPPKIKLPSDDPNFIPTRQVADVHDFDDVEAFQELSASEQKAESILLVPSQDSQFEYFIDGPDKKSPENRLNIVGSNDAADDLFEGHLNDATPHTAESLAALIAPVREKTKATTLRLISDKAAHTDFPQALANATGLNVEAPLSNAPLLEVMDNRYWLMAEPRSSSNPLSGQWRTFIPN